MTGSIGHRLSRLALHVVLLTVGVIFMLGAEVNAALMKYRVRRVVKAGIRTGSLRRALEADEAADI